MEKQLMQVLEFQKGVNAPLPETPTMLPVKRARLRQSLLEEEVTEIATAVHDWHFPDEKEPRFETEQDAITEVLDGIIDCLYVLLGTAHEYGLADRLIFAFNEVHDSNITKFGENGTAAFRADGKLLKPETYRKPNLSQIVRKDLRAFKDMNFLNDVIQEEQDAFIRKVDEKIEELLPSDYKSLWKNLISAQNFLNESKILKVDYDFSDLLNGRKAVVSINGEKTIINENESLVD